MIIALDAMGGDNAPQEIISGAVQALEEIPADVSFKLVGDESLIKAELDKYKVDLARFSIVHTSEVVTMDDPPTAAIRSKKDSSIAIAVKLVKEGEADALVSAGNTGASVACCVLKLGRLPGIDRPAIATVIPAPEGKFVLLDSGANVDSKPEMLNQFSIMGEIYAKAILELESPRVGLFSNGSEDGKGNEVTKATFKLLKENDYNFIGNVEGTDLFKDKVDVVVCDGFIGNLVLKSCEGIAKGISGMLKKNIKKKQVRKVGYALSKGAFDELKEKTDSRATGGAPLLGVNGIFIKAHGSSDAYALKNALKVAHELTLKEINKQIIAGIEQEA
jgi:phosphate acyltransferase